MRVRTFVRWGAQVAAAALIAAGLMATAGGVSGPLAGAAAPTASPSAGYWLVGADGGVFNFGDAPFFGSEAGKPIAKAIVGMAATPSSNGYWLVAADGGVFSYGDASFFGSMAGKPLAKPIVGMAATPDGNGYWLVGADGGVFAFGDAGFRGSMAGKPLDQPIVGMVATPTGNGYWLVGADGGVFSFGDATFFGSMAGKPLDKPIVGMAATPDGGGYWLVGADGSVFNFGDAGSFGSMAGKPLGKPIVGMAATSDGNGYWLVGADGSVFNFGDAGSFGSMGAKPLDEPIVGMAPVGPTVGGRVLQVGTYDGHPGQFASIQAAVDAARPGDWILVAPGDYHETADHASPPSASDVSSGWYGGVEVSTPDIHIRGMDRNSVIVDGTLPGSQPCSANPAQQDFGVPGASGPDGRNGIVVWKADNVTIQNLTVCNFLQVNGNGGNEIWWNGGETGQIGMHGYSGSYLTATDTFDGTYNGISGDGNYGIFSSSSQGPGVWDQIYASNFADSGMYIGACQQVCDAWVHNAWMENNALGYSGTNSGGTVVIDHSQFDNNVDGFDTNTQSVGDPPPPQNGACPDNGVSAITGTNSCWVFMNNYDHDNNNPNAPGYGAEGEPVGTGMTDSGGRNDTIMNNLFANNGAWGTLFVPYPDSSVGAPGVCTGSGGTVVEPLGCVYDPEGDALIHNVYSHNGFFGNPSNSDFGQITLFSGEPQNCYAGNVAPDGSAPANLEQVQPTCGPITTASNTAGPLFDQALCDTGFASALGVSCTGDNYPKPASSAPVLSPLPRGLPTMPNPCQGVPANDWCPGGRTGQPGPSSSAASSGARGAF